MRKLLLALVAGVCLLGSSSVATAQHAHGHSHAVHPGHSQGSHSWHGHYASHAAWARYHRVVFVRTVVPATRVEVVTVAPGADFVWSTGYWAWTGVQYVWTTGSWVRVVPGRVWVQPCWRYRGWTQAHGHRYVHVRGHWR